MKRLFPDNSLRRQVTEQLTRRYFFGRNAVGLAALAFRLLRKRN